MNTATHEPRSRPTFRERVFALSGHSTWREPNQGSSEQRQIPTDHLVAAALSFGRRNPADIGPDIAFDMATGRTGHWRKVCEWTGKQMATERTASARRCKPFLAHIAIAAYNHSVSGCGGTPAPDGCREDDWAEMVLFACLLLTYAAEDALALAARRNRRAA